METSCACKMHVSIVGEGGDVDHDPRDLEKPQGASILVSVIARRMADAKM